MQRGLLQAEHVDHGPVQDVVGLGEELVKAPTLLLIGLQDVGEHRSQEALKAPETPEHTRCSEPAERICERLLLSGSDRTSQQPPADVTQTVLMLI